MILLFLRCSQFLMTKTASFFSTCCCFWFFLLTTNNFFSLSLFFLPMNKTRYENPCKRALINTYKTHFSSLQFTQVFALSLFFLFLSFCCLCLFFCSLLNPINNYASLNKKAANRQLFLRFYDFYCFLFLFECFNLNKTKN